MPSISGRNTVYGPEVDVSKMTKLEKINWQSAMRQRRRRIKLSEQKTSKAPKKRYIYMAKVLKNLNNKLLNNIRNCYPV